MIKDMWSDGPPEWGKERIYVKFTSTLDVFEHYIVTSINIPEVICSSKSKIHPDTYYFIIPDRYLPIAECKIREYLEKHLPKKQVIDKPKGGSLCGCGFFHDPGERCGPW